MVAIKACSVSSTHVTIIPTKPPTIPSFSQPLKYQQPKSSVSFRYRTRSKVKFNSSNFSRVSTEPEDMITPKVENSGETEKFDWYSRWYPVMPLCDLDKRVPHAKKIMGIDVVVWWDRNEQKWQVFEDKCPHRLAPLSEGRIDQWGRLQCVYHGWCFSGSGNCKFIPQAPPDGLPHNNVQVNTVKKACVAVYPTIEQNQVLWFWPNSAPQYKDIAVKEKPPYIPELDDPSFYTSTMFSRDIPYGYEVLIENLMDPSHVPYAHYGIMKLPICPGYSRLIAANIKNYAVWVDRLVPRWIIHLGLNLLIDSDLYLLHLEEHKIIDAGPINWQKNCFVPTKADAMVIAFRLWLRKYSGGQVDWGTKSNGSLPPTPLKEQLLDSSCHMALKGLKPLQVTLQVISASIGIAAAIKQDVMSMAAKVVVVSMTILFFAASKWLSHFIYKSFYSYDYNHALR
ncbi:hypothetical protein AQUCO_00400653v1 [Aquilegia coerulea]|uniref:Rieske domain-containing protein n=1 Tax=Aquilegia coerulea TaxID=218851 RepID=A0A2G5EW11_AQUCA|nr:hypothetical protein AQUCO_00400653v1 [Aquilegia coerulea]